MKDWKIAPAPFDKYEVSQDGQVRNRCTKHVLSPDKNNSGYLVVHLLHRKTVLVHRLVAMTFIPNPENKKYVDHINTVRDDNRVSNLRWVTGGENARNELTAERRKQAAAVFKTPEFRAKQSRSMQRFKRSVICVETGERWESAAEAARVLGIPKNRIYLSCKSAYKHGMHRCKSSHGQTVQHFRYENYKEGEQPQYEFGVRKTSRSVMCSETGQVWKSVKLASLSTGLSSHYIESACNRAALPNARPIRKYKGKTVMHFHYV